MNTPKPAADMLFDALRMRNDKQRELNQLLERKRSLLSELATTEEQVAMLDAQVKGHEKEALRYMKELVLAG